MRSRALMMMYGSHVLRVVRTVMEPSTWRARRGASRGRAAGAVRRGLRKQPPHQVELARDAVLLQRGRDGGPHLAQVLLCARAARQRRRGAPRRARERRSALGLALRGCCAACAQPRAPRYFGNSVAKELSSSMPPGLSSFVNFSIFLQRSARVSAQLHGARCAASAVAHGQRRTSGRCRPRPRASPCGTCLACRRTARQARRRLRRQRRPQPPRPHRRPPPPRRGAWAWRTQPRRSAAAPGVAAEGGRRSCGRKERHKHTREGHKRRLRRFVRRSSSPAQSWRAQQRLPAAARTTGPAKPDAVAQKASAEARSRLRVVRSIVAREGACARQHSGRRASAQCTVSIWC
jgi:hypothetical protein